jgi:hypothetical protein
MSTINSTLIDELLKDYKSPDDIIGVGMDGLGNLTSRLASSVLEIKSHRKYMMSGFISLYPTYKAKYSPE